MEKLKFQKLLFLLTKNQITPAYEFLPYKYGCFSFLSYADLRTMVKYGYINEKMVGCNSFWFNVGQKDFTEELYADDLSALQTIKNKFGDCSNADLIKYTYTNYPYHAINSIISHQFIGPNVLKIIEDYRPNQTQNTLFTIGYEGITLEGYLNKLIQNNIKVLCDVRKNPVSMKYGFSKNLLNNTCESIGIKYIHLPSLGIESKKRQNLRSQSDYELLFDEYKKTTLNNTLIDLYKIFNLIKTHSRIAITCFEANIHQCHRKHLAEKLLQLPNWKYEVRHL